MATIITFNGTTYTVPSYGDTGWAQGAGNLSSYLVAIAAGTLQTTGGTFTLSADVNFGASFGLLAAYFKTRAANPALTGLFRMASTDSIVWRNNANGADIALSKNASDVLLYNGVPVITGAAGITPVTAGGTGVATLTAHGVMIGEGTSNVAVTAAGTTGAPLLSGGAGADPAFAAISMAGGASVITGTLPVGNGGSGAATFTAHGVLVGEGASAFAATATGTSGQPLLSGGAGADPAYGNLAIPAGGTGAATFTAHGVLIGEGTSAIAATAAGTSGQPLLSGGAAADPAYGTLGVSFGGTGLTTATTYAVLCGGTSGTGAFQSIASVGTAAQVLTSNGAGALPTFQAPTNAAVRTRQVFLSGSGATYTTPANCRQLFIRMLGGGGGGGAQITNAGTAGNTTTFNSINANGGAAGGIATSNIEGSGGAGGTGSASFRMAGNPGNGGSGNAHATNSGGTGGWGFFGGGSAGNPQPNTAADINGVANSGSGGAGGGTFSTGIQGCGGGAGEYVEITINSPSASYTYTVAAAANGGAAGTVAGGNGGSGVIIVDEYY